MFLVILGYYEVLNTRAGMPFRGLRSLNLMYGMLIIVHFG